MRMTSEGQSKASACRGPSVAAALQCKHPDTSGAAIWGNLGVVTGAHCRFLWHKRALPEFHSLSFCQKVERLLPATPAVSVA